MIFGLAFTTRARKDLTIIPQHDQANVLRMIGTLRQDPFPHGKNPKRLTGLRLFRLRVGVYRVLYDLHEQHVIVRRVLHRKDAYR